MKEKELRKEMVSLRAELAALTAFVVDDLSKHLFEVERSIWAIQDTLTLDLTQQVEFLQPDEIEVSGEPRKCDQTFNAKKVTRLDCVPAQFSFEKEKE